MSTLILRTNIEQILSRNDAGTPPLVQLYEVVTEHPVTAALEGMPAAELQGELAWLADLHAAEVELASAEPAVRRAVEALDFGNNDLADLAEAIRAAIRTAQEQS